MKNNRKMFLLFTLICFALCAFAACGIGGGNTPPAGDGNEEPPAEDTVIFNYTLKDDDTYEVSGCEGEAASLVIPATYNDKAVTSIGNSALRDRDRMTSVTLPDSVTSIGNVAFAFCRDLTNINIPAGVASIGEGAFIGCGKLTSIALPASLANIGMNAFHDCHSLESITVDENNAVYSGRGNCLVEKETKKLLIGCKNSVIPDDGSVEIIEDSVFYECSGLTSIVIPDSVTRIRDSAFRRCHDLTSLTIGSGVTRIEYMPFSECESLESITVDENNTVFHSKDNCLIKTEDKELIAGCKNSVIPDDGTVTKIGPCAFNGCLESTNITIPSGITSIDSYAFGYCKGITSIVLPTSVESVAYQAFMYCENLTSVTIGRGVTRIRRSAFEYCDNLASITVDENNTVYHSAGNCVIETETKKLVIGCKDSVIPDDGSVTSIGGAFSQCQSLTSITIPVSVTEINGAFYGCDNLTSITYRGTMEQWRAINKEDSWDFETGNYTVHCNNGDISK